MRLRLRERTLDLEPGRPLVMGIVNASPESFSDGARIGGLDDQVARALAMGADLIDVGGESGVTDRPPVPAEEGAERVVPLVEKLAARGVIVSVDTWKAPVARAAVEAGAAMINDVSGLSDLGVAEVCAQSGAALVIMHTRARPKEKVFPDYDDVGADVLEFLRERIATARSQGVEDEQIVIDPGPDFAKTPAETVEVLRRLPKLRDLGQPVLLAASRKDFVGALCGRAPADRLAGTLAAIGEGVTAGAAIVRVHDVPATRDFLTVRAALRGEIEVPRELRLDQHLRRQAGSPA